ncbi:MAG: hypothetical protein AAB511_01285 [Patescibacteria group bacterium]
MNSQVKARIDKNPLFISIATVSLKTALCDVPEHRLLDLNCKHMKASFYHLNLAELNALGIEGANGEYFIRAGDHKVSVEVTFDAVKEFDGPLDSLALHLTLSDLPFPHTEDFDALGLQMDCNYLKFRLSVSVAHQLATMANVTSNPIRLRCGEDGFDNSHFAFVKSVEGADSVRGFVEFVCDYLHAINSADFASAGCRLSRDVGEGVLHFDPFKEVVN